jgi:hypothetical protein
MRLGAEAMLHIGTADAYSVPRKAGHTLGAAAWHHLPWARAADPSHRPCEAGRCRPHHARGDAPARWQASAGATSCRRRTAAIFLARAAGWSCTARVPP